MSDVPVDRVMLSASQISTFQDCPRKWAFEKLDKIERPQSGAANAGTAIHTEVEHWIKRGEVPESKPAQALVETLKTLGITPGRSNVMSEAPFTFAWPELDPTWPPVWVRGFIDLIDLADPEHPKVYDFKTVGTAQGFKRSKDVASGPQGVLYPLGAKLVAQDYGLKETDAVEMSWLYVVRDEKAKTHSAPWVVAATTIEAGLQALDPVVREMAALTVKKAKALTVLADRTACYKYGPCPYREACPDFPKPKLKGAPPVSNDDLSALAGLSGLQFPPANLQDDTLTVAAPQPLFEPPAMPLLDALVAKDVVVQIVPADAQPNVSQNDPTPPPVVVQKRGRGRPRKVAVVPTSIGNGVIVGGFKPGSVPEATDPELKDEPSAFAFTPDPVEFPPCAGWRLIPHPNVPCSELSAMNDRLGVAVAASSDEDPIITSIRSAVLTDVAKLSVLSTFDDIVAFSDKTRTLINAGIQLVSLKASIKERLS